MKLLEKILVAVDLSPGSEKVINAARSLASTFRSEIVLLTTLRKLTVSDAESKKYAAMVREGAENKLATYRTQLEESGIRVADPIVAEGSAFDQIIHHAEELGVNVTLVATDHDMPSKPDLGTGMGVTAERVCRKSNNPVWVVSGEDKQEVRRILCPVDRSSPSRRALRNAIHLARQMNAKLHVLHVTVPLMSKVGIDIPVDEFERYRQIQSEQEPFDEFIQEFDFHGIDWDSRIEVGDPAEWILSTANQLDADLIVMGSVGRTGLARILMGSVAGTVIHKMSCSIVMMKAEDAIRIKIDQELEDIRMHYHHANDLLDNGFPKEALAVFEHCVYTNEMFLPAWEGMALAHERLGSEDKAEQCRQTAKELDEVLSWRRIEAEIRSQHTLWKS